jgi:hypothetical protein
VDGGVVPVGAVDPGVVGGLVVVPGGDERVRLVDALQVRVELVLGVPAAVLLEGVDLGPGSMNLSPGASSLFGSS